MSETIKVEALSEDRTPEQAARAAPVSLPAGSYDTAELQKALDEASKAKNLVNRDQMVDEAVAKIGDKGTDHGALDLQESYRRVDVVDEVVGVTESRIVFDPAAAQAAGDTNAEATAINQATGAANAAKKGE